MENLLKETKYRLIAPSLEAKRKLLITMNIVYILATILFLVSEKVAEGKFVPQLLLMYWVYIPAIILNFISLLYNLSILTKSKIKAFSRSSDTPSTRRLYDYLSAWISMIAIMFMSTCNMLGVGNPSNDSMLTDFALGHSLIVVAVIVIGRKGAFVWFIMVMALLVYKTNDLGWDYQYHYMTSQEVENYEGAIDNNEEWALERADVIMSEGLNPPKVTRYFNVWFIFIVVSFLTAIFFSGITNDLLKIIPPAVDNIEVAIRQSIERTIELKQKDLKLEENELKVARINEFIEKFKNTMSNVGYKERLALKPVVDFVINEWDIAKEMEFFGQHFEAVNSNLFAFLSEKYPDLSSTEKKYMVYVKVGITNKEAAPLLGTTMDALKTLRYRLKKKLALDEGIQFDEFISSLKS